MRRCLLGIACGVMCGEQRRDLGAQPPSAGTGLVEECAALFTVALKRRAKHGLHFLLLFGCHRPPRSDMCASAACPRIISPEGRLGKRDQM
jgi:hypothetical protein